MIQIKITKDVKVSKKGKKGLCFTVYRSKKKPESFNLTPKEVKLLRFLIDFVVGGKDDNEV
jgi:hypothetical protein